MEQEKITLEWDVQIIEDNARITATYCFKNCSANQN